MGTVRRTAAGPPPTNIFEAARKVPPRRHQRCLSIGGSIQTISLDAHVKALYSCFEVQLGRIRFPNKALASNTRQGAMVQAIYHSI
jgi:hypothetical protein